MPFGSDRLDTVIPQMGPYTDDVKDKEPLLPITAESIPDEQRCLCACRRRRIKSKSRGRRAFRHLVFIGLSFLLIRAVLTHFNIQLWGCTSDSHLRDLLNPAFGNGPGHDHDEWFYDIPENLELGECVTGDNFEEEEGDGHLRAASVTFEVPQADTLFYVARGQLSAGAVKVLSSPDQAQNSATIKVTARYARDEIVNLAKVCLSSRNGNSNAKGVGAFTPTWRYHHPHGHHDVMHFETTVILPEGSEDSPFDINDFETDVLNTSHRLEDLSKVFFTNVKLSSSNSPVHALFLQGATVSVETSNTPIEGSFNTTKSLRLVTKNSSIKARVGLQSNSDEDTVSIGAYTTNSPIGLDVSATSSNGPGSFAVGARTANGPLAISFAEAPLDSKLVVDASTSNSPAKIALHPTYEGKFTISTSKWFSATLSINEEYEDPAGKGRKKTVRANQNSREHVEGETMWDADKHGPGVINLHTSNSPVTLAI